MTYKFQVQVCNDHTGYEQLNELYKIVSELAFDTLILDFSSTRWFEANLCATLGAILTLSNEQVNTLRFIWPANDFVKDIFERNGFLSFFGGIKRQDIFSSTIQFRKFDVNEDTQFNTYLAEQLFSFKSPKMSTALKQEFSKKIFEIFENARTHGGSRFVYCCGQRFPSTGKLDFTIADLGNTIKRNVNRCLNTNYSGKEAIEWATKEGHTTKTGRIPGGLGFHLIRSFLKLNKGQMQIISADGYYEEGPEKIIMKDLSHSFRGTIVNLEFNLNDTQSYILNNEIDPNSIF